MLHAYVDESARGDYLLCAAVIAPADCPAVRQALRALLLPGMARLHMAKETPDRRRAILSLLSAQSLKTVLYVSHYQVQRQGRAEIMRRMVGGLGVDRLVIESRHNADIEDNRALREAVAKGRLERFSYVHEQPKREPMLWVPDAVAWAYGKGGDWRRRAQPVVSRVEIVDP